MEEEQTGTHTLAEWKAWYAEQRSDEVEFVTAAEPAPEDETELERLWLAGGHPHPRWNRLAVQAAEDPDSWAVGAGRREAATPAARRAGNRTGTT